MIVTIFILVIFLFEALITSYQGYFSELSVIFAFIFLFPSETKSYHTLSFLAQVIYPFLALVISFTFTLSFAIPVNLESFFFCSFKSILPLLFSYYILNLKEELACSIRPFSD